MSKPVFDQVQVQVGASLAELDALCTSASRQPDRAVHRLRQCLNRLAEGVAFLAALHQRGHARLQRLRRRLLSARKRLSRLRDRQALLTTWHRYRGDLSLPPVPGGRSTARAAMRELRPVCGAATVATLRLSRAVNPPSSDDRLWRHVLRRYRAARKRARRLDADAPGQEFHGWRKAVRRLVLAVDIAGMRPVRPHWAERLDRLARLLGRDRDLHLLKQALADEQGHHRRPKRRLARKRRRMRERAVRLRRRLFRQGGKAFLRTLGWSGA